MQKIALFNTSIMTKLHKKSNCLFMFHKAFSQGFYLTEEGPGYTIKVQLLAV